MVQFSGCLGSRKTTHALQIAQHFTSHPKHTSLYINPVSPSEAKRAIIETGSYGLEAGIPKLQTDAGIYMLAVKAVHLA